MRKNVVAATLLVLTLLGLGACAPVKTGTASCSPSPNIASELIKATNRDRATIPVRPVVVDPQLTSNAQAWAEQMAGVGVLYHSGAEGENIATAGVCVLPNGGAVEDFLFASKGHGANIRYPDWGRIGVGVAYDNKGRIWISQLFDY